MRFFLSPSASWTACTLAALLLAQPVACKSGRDSPLSRLQRMAGTEHRFTQAGDGSSLFAFTSMNELIRSAEAGREAQIVASMFANSELEKVFSEPDVLLIMLEQMPVLKSLKGVREYYDKGADLTSQDGLAVLAELRTFAADGLQAVTNLMGEDASQNVADNLARYSTSEDPAIQELVRQVGLGNATANLALQQVIADDHLNGLLDLDELGINGQEPDSFKSLRDRFLAEPLFASFLDDIADGKQAVLDPLNLAKRTVAAVSDQSTA